MFLTTFDILWIYWWPIFALFWTSLRCVDQSDTHSNTHKNHSAAIVFSSIKPANITTIERRQDINAQGMYQANFNILENHSEAQMCSFMSFHEVCGPECHPKSLYSCPCIWSLKTSQNDSYRDMTGFHCSRDIVQYFSYPIVRFKAQHCPFLSFP